VPDAELEPDGDDDDELGEHATASAANALLAKKRDKIIAAA
jgi:hypothetical protein